MWFLNFCRQNTQVWILSSELTSHKLFNPLSRPLPSPVSLPFSLSLSPTTNLSVYLSPSRNIVATSTSTSGSKKKSTSTTLPHSHTSKISRIEFVNPFNLFRTKSFLNPVLVQIKSTFHFFHPNKKNHFPISLAVWIWQSNSRSTEITTTDSYLRFRFLHFEIRR